MSRHVLTIAEMTKHLESRDDLTPAVKAKVLAGESCTSLERSETFPLLALAGYAARYWAETGTKMGMPTAAPVGSPRSAAPPVAARASTELEARFVHDGVTLTASQLKAKVKAGEIGDFERVRRVGKSQLEQVRNLPEVRDPPPAFRTPAPVAAAPPLAAPRAPAVASSSILRNFHRGQRDELDTKEPELSPFRRLTSSHVAPAASEPKAAPQQARSLPPSRIAARAQQIALEAHNAPPPTDPGPEAA